MIISGTVASPSVQGVAGTGPADLSPPNGSTVVAQNGKWCLSTGSNAVVTALGTAVATATSSLLVDWTVGGFFTCTAYGGGWTITFTNAAGVFTPQAGQIIRINITHAGSSAITWPSTVTWITASAAAPACATYNMVVALICTNAGTAPTFLGWVEGTSATAIT